MGRRPPCGDLPGVAPRARVTAGVCLDSCTVARALVAVRAGRVERGHDLVVVAARLAVAQELRALDLDLPGAGLRLEQRDGLRHELAERHRELAVLLAGQIGRASCCARTDVPLP